MTIGRRNLFGLGALGAGVVALEGCGGGLVPESPANMGPDDVERLLTAVDETVLHLKALDADPKGFGIKGTRPEVGEGRARCIGLLTTLCFMGTYRDLPESVRNEPRVAEHLAKTMPQLRSTLAAARAHLVGMTDEEINSIDQRLTKDPNLAMRIMERIDGYAKEIHVPLAQRTYLRLSTAELAARFRYEGTAAVTGKLASTYERVLSSKIAALGLDREDFLVEGPAAEPKGPSHRSPRIHPNLFAAPGWSRAGTEGESCTTKTDCEGELECVRGTCASTEKPESEKIMLAAKQGAKWGAIFMIPPLCGIGVLILLTTLFMVIVAGMVYAGED